jgi:alkylated DNA repair dioxygenase AlkB
VATGGLADCRHSRQRMQVSHADLFDRPQAELPEGFRYRPDLISEDEERVLVEHIAGLPLKEFEFQGFLGKRRIVSFGWRYDFNGGGLQQTEDMPAFLLAVREQAAVFAGLRPERLQQVLLTEYRPGVQIGWHKDRSVFGEVIGISLLSACNFRLRRKAGVKWERAAITADPRSAYLLSGPSRTEWEHSIPGVQALRYSITFRNFKNEGK